MSEHSFQLQADNRQELTTLIDMALISTRARISKGTYEVTIRRVTKKELDEQEKEAVLKQAADRAMCNVSGHVLNSLGKCARCLGTFPRP